MAIRSVSEAPLVVTAAPATDPTSGTVIVDTGALNSGIYEVKVSVGASAAALFTLQHRNAANSANNKAISIRGAQGQTGEYIWDFFINSQERVRVVMGANLTGDAEATIQVQRIG